MGRRSLCNKIFWDWSYHNPKINKMLLNLENSFTEINITLKKRSVKMENKRFRKKR